MFFFVYTFLYTLIPKEYNYHNYIFGKKSFQTIFLKKQLNGFYSFVDFFGIKSGLKLLLCFLVSYNLVLNFKIRSILSFCNLIM